MASHDVSSSVERNSFYVGKYIIILCFFVMRSCTKCINFTRITEIVSFRTTYLPACLAQTLLIGFPLHIFQTQPLHVLILRRPYLFLAGFCLIRGVHLVLRM